MVDMDMGSWLIETMIPSPSTALPGFVVGKLGTTSRAEAGVMLLVTWCSQPLSVRTSNQVPF